MPTLGISIDTVGHFIYNETKYKIKRYLEIMIDSWRVDEVVFGDEHSFAIEMDYSMIHTVHEVVLF